MPVRTRATVKTVAELAGVSTTTVSRVLNGKGDTISQATRDRVVEAARTLDYRPNTLAVGLRKATTRTLGLMIPDIANAYFHQLARGAEDTAMALGYTVIFCNTDRRPEKEAMYIDVLSDKRVDGIIFSGAGMNDDQHIAARLDADAQVVTIGPHRLPFPSIGVDEGAAIAAAVAHLAEQGCRAIACIGGEPEWLIHEERLAGFRRGLLDAGLPVHEERLLASDFTIASASSAVEHALDAGLAFDGIVGFNDYAAIGAMRALRGRGLGIPGDVAVIGCDGLVVGTLVEPPLSSISFPLYEFGAAASRMVIAMSEGRPVERRVEFPFELVVRESSLRARPA
jgi:LacI family transcriptional regulator